MKLDGQPFMNGPACQGVSFGIDDTSHDLAIIEITGRYPEKGAALNKISHELVFISEGKGEVIIEGNAQTLQPGDVVSIPPDKHFFWQGNMKMIMSCQPAFTAEQYEVKDTYEI